jgi:putative endonuclease
MFYTYTLKSKLTGKIYIGQTENLNLRLKRHNQKLKSKNRSYTKINKGPWQLIYKEEFKTRKEAIKREKELKSAQGRKFIKSLENEGP